MAMIPWIPEGFVQATYRFSVAGVSHTMSTSLGWSTNGLAEDVQASQLNNIWEAAIMQEGARMANSGTFLGTTCRFGRASGPDAIVEHPAAVAGTQGSPSLPPNCALLVLKRTGLAGRAFRGRMFLPSCLMFEVEVSDAGVLLPAIVTGNNAALATMIESSDTSGFTPFLFHMVDSSAPEPPAFGPTTITQLVCSPTIATQRGRLR